MFSRFFGETIEQQIHYLQPRVIITLVSILLSAALGLIVSPDLFSLFLIAAWLIWGWSAVKSLFGFGTVGALFSRNIVIACVILVFSIVVSYILGLIFALLGFGRFIYLKAKYKGI